MLGITHNISTLNFQVPNFNFQLFDFTSWTILVGYHFLRGTDKTNITRKPSKTGKHRHEERKSTKEAKDSKPKPRKVNLQSTLVISKLSLAKASKESHVAMKKAQEEEGFTLFSLTQLAQAVTSKE
ncbi:hypothetical protein Tco_1125508 [Tanacetum coccineum]|uniref:Uncharacterized protein n=1 Tax=Tanacetum coccineum TaxID=301880 RepID=A0ABQ5JC65_9ASTR